MKQFLLFFLLAILVSNNCSAQQELDLNMVIAEQGELTLTMDDILVVLMSQQQKGLISMDPTEEQIQTVALLTTQQFQLNPAQCMQEIQALRTQFNYFGLDDPTTLQSDLHGMNQPTSPAINQSQKSSENNIATFIQQYYPGTKLDFNNSQAVQVRTTLSGALIYNQDSDTYNSGSFGTTTVTSTEIHLCPNGTMTQVITSRMAGGSDLGSFDTGSDDAPVIERGNWSIGLLNGQLAFMIFVDGVAGGFPIVFEGSTMIMDGKRYEIASGRAVCY